MKQNYINHIALVLDASASMTHLTRELIKVADSQIAYLAQRSKELDQETRITVYTFNNTVTCVVYDKDVLRLPSIAEFYRPQGMTALIDATIKSQDDLAATAQLYGDHAFLTYVLTDGQENRSAAHPGKLSGKLGNLPDNWTVAVLVPDQNGKFEAKKFGFPADNIAIWDATTVKGVVEVGETIRQATDNFMVGRASGVRGTRSLFSTSVDTLNKQTVKDAKLKPLAKGTYEVLPVNDGPVLAIRDYVQKEGHEYLIGKAFYQLTKTESIQPQKMVAVYNKKTRRYYTGSEARNLLGLPDMEVRVKPDVNPEYDVFVQSTSVNRKLVPGTKLLLLK